MSEFSAAELAGMRATQDAHMMDRCTVDAYSDAGAGTYNYPQPTWTPGQEIRCGFQAVAVDEALAQGADVPTVDARLRLPIATALGSKDRVTVTRRHGAAVPPVQYEVVGEPKRGPSGLVLDLRKVTDA